MADRTALKEKAGAEIPGTGIGRLERPARDTIVPHPQLLIWFRRRVRPTASSGKAVRAQVPGSGTAATVAVYDWITGETVNAKEPPASGSPFHHSAFNRKFPVSTVPSGADASQVSAKRAADVTASNGTVTVAPGARMGKSRMRFGVPNAKEPGETSVVTNQSVVLWFLMQ